jgi:hypothetical protein
MIAAGAVGPVQHATQVQNAKIKALTGVVKRLQDRRSLEEVASQRTQGLPESSKECDSIERKHTETTYDSPVTHVDFEVSLAGSTHPNQPMPTSGKTFEDESGRELHRKQHFFWRQFAESQLIQERAKQSPITNGVLSDTMIPPVGGSPPKLLFSNSTWKSDNDHQRTRQETGHALPRTQSGSSGTHESILLQPSTFPLSDGSPKFGAPLSTVIPKDPLTNIITIQFKLGLDFGSIGPEGSAQRVAFRNELQHDLANACQLPPSSFVVKRLSPGSVIVLCEIYPDNGRLGPDPGSAAADLQEQAGHAESKLRKGSLTRFISEINIVSRSQVKCKSRQCFVQYFAPNSDVFDAQGTAVQSVGTLANALAHWPTTSDSANPLTALPSTVRSRSPFPDTSHKKVSAKFDPSKPQDKSGSIGLLLEQHRLTGHVFIKSLMPGGPAQRNARLRKGDRLLTVDGNAVNGLELSEVFDMIKGKPGTQVCTWLIYGNDGNMLDCMAFVCDITFILSKRDILRDHPWPFVQAKLQIQRKHAPSMVQTNSSLPNPGLPSLTSPVSGNLSSNDQSEDFQGSILQIDIKRENLVLQPSNIPLHILPPGDELQYEIL